MAEVDGCDRCLVEVRKIMRGGRRFHGDLRTLRSRIRGFCPKAHHSCAGTAGMNHSRHFSGTASSGSNAARTASTRATACGSRGHPGSRIDVREHRARPRSLARVLNVVDQAVFPRASRRCSRMCLRVRACQGWLCAGSSRSQKSEERRERVTGRDYR